MATTTTTPPLLQLSYDFTTLRGLNKQSCQKFCYGVGIFKKKPVHIMSYFKGNLQVAQKLRTKDKQFFWIGNSDRLGFFGQQLWDTGGRKITITEGEIDAVSVSQVLDHKYPVVSLPHGAQSAVRVIKQELDYLETFKEVIFMFDMDEYGQKAALESCELLTPGKGKIASLSMKDPNELLMNGRQPELVSAIWNARSYVPEGIVNAREFKDEVLEPTPKGLSYPWASLTDATYGLRAGELITLGAGTGVGKTTFLKQIAFHLITKHKEKVGLFFLEESCRTTLLSLLSMKMKKPLHLPSDESNIFLKGQIAESFKTLFSQDQVYLFDHFGTSKFETIKAKIRAVVIHHNVKYIFLDHLTALTLDMSVVNERRELDLMMVALASLVQELNITLFLVSHLNTPVDGTTHEEGARVTLRHFRGSRSICQWSNIVWALERDQQSVIEENRHTATVRILKNRYWGPTTGITFPLLFNIKAQSFKESEREK